MRLAGRYDNGMFRSWFTEARGRRITYREGSTTAPAVRVPLREVLDYADRRLTATEWRRIDQLAAVRSAAMADAHPRGLQRSPARRSDVENSKRRRRARDGRRRARDTRHRRRAGR